MNDNTRIGQFSEPWLRVKQVVGIIPKSTLYPLLDINGGSIRTSCLKRRGKRRGIRLIETASLLAAIESGATTEREGGANHA